jgi:KDO2-lipid IV(A) lauroyltransferase
MTRVSLYLLRGLESLFGAMSYRTARAVGRGIGFLLGRVLRYRRAYVLDTLRRCLPDRAPDAARIADGMYRNLGLLIAECLYFSGRRADEFARYVDARGLEHVEAVRARGGGALVLMGHIGNWELMGLAAASIWRPVNVIVKSIGNSGVDTYWRTARARMGLRLLPRNDAMRACIKALRAGEVVALILDQNMRRHRGIFVDFFGRPACTSPGLAYLSAATRTPVLPVYMIRAPDGRHTLRIEPPIEPPPDREEETIRAYTQRYTSTLEALIRAHPEQWTWIHKRWKTKPPDPDHASDASARK